MTDAELEARARRAYEAAYKPLVERAGGPVRRWEDTGEETRDYYRAIARAVLEEPPTDPFEAWYEHRTCGLRDIDLARAAWNAAISFVGEARESA